MVEESLKINTKECQAKQAINELLVSPKDKQGNILESTDINKNVKRKTDDSISPASKKQRQDSFEDEEIEQTDNEAFDWSTYLTKTNATAVNKCVFKHVVPDCGFEAGMKLEVPNRDYPSTFWLATIITKASPLILVRYEGYHDNNEQDIWFNTLKDNIHPVGWCARTKHTLKPPKAIQNKEKDWYSYLIKHLTGARKASEHLFKKSHPVNYLQVGHFVEVIDHSNPKCYWLARITGVFSGRLYLQYEGWNEKAAEIHCYYLDERLRAIGHGIRNGLTLYPPEGAPAFTHVQFNKITEQIIKLSRKDDIKIFESCFTGAQNLKEHNVCIGMKLESFHPKDPTIICVASVARIFDQYFFLIKIDDLISPQEEMANSFVVHKGSLGLFEVGFCHKNGLPLQQPRGYNGKFTWEGYLKYMKAKAVPSSFFEPEEVEEKTNIDVGMKLEAVDLENKSNIAVATISKIVDNYLWLKLDGDARNEQIVHVRSFNIFPAGWCQSSGHELQWPRPNTLEQKNRISSLRHTATRRNRLEVLRKGKLREKTDSNKPKHDLQKQNSDRNKRKRFPKRGRRGVSRSNVSYDKNDSSNSITDTSIAIVCINRLANEYNSEQSIKKSFGLDNLGRLPKQVVTIDDSSDEDDDVIASDSKQKKPFSEGDIDYFSSIKLKPKTLTKLQEKMFNTKVKENEGNKGVPIDINAASNNREKRSLNSVVAMLRATRNLPQSQLLAQYKESKKSVTKETPSTVQHKNVNNNTEKYPTNIPLHGNSTSLLKDESPVRIPGKGDFQVVEKIVTKEGDKNKVILKLGKQVNSSKSPLTNINNNVHYVSDPNPKTSLQDMSSLNNMVRTHPGCDEIFRNRCNKVRSMCRDLPTNPLVWTRFHVASFMKKAEMAKYANLFIEQEVDGHSLLLLTVNDLYNVLGIHLGPAAKIHDYIFTLQQLVNNAYFNNKLDVTLLEDIDQNPMTGPQNSTEHEQTTQEKVKNKENIPRKNDVENAKENSSNHKVASWITSLDDKPDIVSNDGQQQEINDKYETRIRYPEEADEAPQIKDDIIEKSRDRSESVGANHEERPSFTVKEDSTDGTSAKDDLLVNNIASANQPTSLRMMHGNDVVFVPTPRYAENHPQINYLYQVPYNLYRYPVPMPMQNGIPSSGNIYPVRFITDKKPSKKSNKTEKHEKTPQEQTRETDRVSQVETKPDINSNSLTIRPVGPIPNIGQIRYVIPHIPAQMKNEHKCGRGGKYQHNIPEATMNEPILNGNQTIIFDKYLKDVDIQLRGEDLWNKFHKHNTEMVITRAGRRIFPSLQVTVSGMSPKVKYAIILDVIPADNHRYKYEYESSEWMVACDELTPKPEQIYIHPESPTLGNIWMKGVVDFTRCKLTNNVSDKNGHIVVTSMHRYQPRIMVVYWDPLFDLQKHLPKKDYLKSGIRKEFIFPQTKFIAVTAYQNTEITHLKIQSNPFARGFRGNWKKRSRYKKKNSDGNSNSEDSDDSGGQSDSETSKTKKRHIDGDNIKDDLETKKIKTEDADPPVYDISNTSNNEINEALLNNQSDETNLDIKPITYDSEQHVTYVEKDVIDENGDTIVRVVPLEE